MCVCVEQRCCRWTCIGDPHASLRASRYSIALGARVLGGTRGTAYPEIRIHGDHGLNFWSYFLRFGVSTHNAVLWVSDARAKS